MRPMTPTVRPSSDDSRSDCNRLESNCVSVVQYTIAVSSRAAPQFVFSESDASSRSTRITPRSGGLANVADVACVGVGDSLVFALPLVSIPGPTPTKACTARPTSWKSPVDSFAGVADGASVGAAVGVLLPILHPALSTSARITRVWRARFINVGKHYPDETCAKRRGGRDRSRPCGARSSRRSRGSSCSSGRAPRVLRPRDG